jgi:hypothetical protein
MHVLKGVVENFMEMTFALAKQQGKVRKSRGNRVPTEPINEALRHAKVPGEVSRTTRDVDKATIKCEELRNYVILLFPLFAEAIGLERKDEYEIWLLLAFLVKAYVIPGNNIPITGITLLSKRPRNCI